MGCCHSIAKVESSLLKNQPDLDKLSKAEAIEAIKKAVSESVKDFQNALQEKITPKRPLSLTEFEQIMKYSIQNELQRFNSKFLRIPEDAEVLEEFKKYKSYLSSKCCSKEGFFRNLNDLYSSELVSNLSSEIIQEFFDGKLAHDEALNKFQKLARGSYVFTGFQVLQGLLQQKNIQQAVEKLTLNMDEVRKSLELNKKELERASRKAFLPLNLEESYSNPLISPKSFSAVLPSPRSPSSSIPTIKVFAYEELTSKSFDTGQDTSVHLNVKNN